MPGQMTTYQDLLKDVKIRIRQAQLKAVMSANAEMLMLYWDIGRMIHLRQSSEGWGSRIIPRLAKDIRNEISEVKGFSERNLDRMLAFYREYKRLAISPPPVAELARNGNAVSNSLELSTPPVDDGTLISPRSVAKLDNILQENVLRISWASNVILMEKVKDIAARAWYMEKTIEQGWTRDKLTGMIKNDAHNRQGRATTNFTTRLPALQSDLAAEILKDPYVFDFLSIDETFHERELESGLILH